MIDGGNFVLHHQPAQQHLIENVTDDIGAAKRAQRFIQGDDIQGNDIGIGGLCQMPDQTMTHFTVCPGDQDNLLTHEFLLKGE